MSKKNKNSGWKKFGIAVLVSSGIYAIVKFYNDYKVPKEIKELQNKTEIVTEEEIEAKKKEIAEEFDENLKKAAKEAAEKLVTTNPNSETEEEEIEDIQNYLYPNIDAKTASVDELQKIFSRVNYVFTKNGSLTKIELLDLKTFERYPEYDYQFFNQGVLQRKPNYINDVISIINPKTMQMVNVYNPYPKVSTITFN